MYTYHHLRSKKTIVLRDHSQRAVEEVFHPQNGDLLLAYSSFSCTVKVYKYVCDTTCTSDDEGLINIGELSLPELLGCTGRRFSIPEAILNVF